MTDKQIFLDKLNAALLDRGISEIDIRPYLERFDRFYERMVSDSDRVGKDLLADVDNIADNIAHQVAQRYDDINRLAERTMTIGKVQDDDSTGEAYEVVQDGMTTSQSGALVDRSVEMATAENSRVPHYVDEESSPSSTMFWVFFAISLPLTIPLALAGIGVFVAFWAALAALIIASIVVLIALVALGSTLSLIGVIYGITQLFEVVPIGLYELGAGVVIAGVSMFAGILLYNFAVRLLPLFMRLIGKLFRYIVRKLRVLFNYLRRECAKL